MTTPYRCAHRWSFSRWRGPLEPRADDLPAPDPHDVTIRITHCGMCHSDLHVQAGGFDMGGGKLPSLEQAGTQLPVTMGHEICGEVVETGGDVHGLPLGTRVVVYAWLGCGACPVCTRGDDHLCPKASRNIGIQRPGGYADLVRVPHERYVVAALTATDHLVIIGCGGVGLTAVALASTLRKARVVAVDPDPAKRDAALAHGAAMAFDPTPADALKTIGKACGLDIAAAVDFVGSESSSSLAVNLVRRTGQVVIVGLFGGEFRMPLPMFALKSISISGSYVGSPQDLRDLIDLAQCVTLPQIPLDLRPLAMVNNALQDLANGRVVGRVVLQT
jgi:D-arabinose 1-dehydrogenase-like Zn-dependent alcohol dehydrogenase